jgi:hypothetical protein
MHIIKGFVTINNFIDNTPGILSPLGELSTWSTTYSKEKGEYQDLTIPGYKLVTFNSSDSTSNEKIQVSNLEVLEILEVVRESINYASVHIRPYDVVDFRGTLLNNFYTRVSNINFGAFVDNGTLALPEWISWNSLSSDTFVKIWLSDQSFSEQYDEYEIVVIPPIINLDDLFGFYNVAVNTMASRTISDLSDIIQNTKGSNPETYLRMLNFNYVNVNNTSQVTPTDWAILVYGRSGDNIDAIKDAIVEYILNNSTHTRGEWTLIFPDIFKRTEFIILPRWDKVAIPNLTVMGALYSSILNPIECISFAKTSISYYPPTFIETNIHIMPYDYKALSLLVINGVDNILGKRDIVDLFSDYIPVSTSLADFNRMSIKTRDWVILLEQLLILAETATEFTSVPNKFRRIMRDGILYISVIYDNINYLVAAKSNSIYSV